MDMIAHQLVEVEQILVVAEQAALHHEHPLVTNNNTLITFLD